MLYEYIDFKTISDRYTKGRMLPFLTHIDGVRANLFSTNPRQKITPTMVNQQLTFHRKIGSNKLFSFYYGRSTTYLSEINRCVFMKLQRQLCDGNADFTVQSYIARLTHTLYLQPVSLRKASYRYKYICLSLKFHPAGTVLHRFCFPVHRCRFFW